MHGASKQPHAWIEKGGVDATEIHIGDALVRVEPAGAALFILQLRRLDGALPRADTADAPEEITFGDENVGGQPSYSQ